MSASASFWLSIATAHDIGPGIDQVVDLPHGGVNVRGLCGRHALHGDRRIAADESIADGNWARRIADDMEFCFSGHAGIVLLTGGLYMLAVCTQFRTESSIPIPRTSFRNRLPHFSQTVGRRQKTDRILHFPAPKCAQQPDNGNAGHECRATLLRIV